MLSKMVLVLLTLVSTSAFAQQHLPTSLSTEVYSGKMTTPGNQTSVEMDMTEHFDSIESRDSMNNTANMQIVLRFSTDAGSRFSTIFPDSNVWLSHTLITAEYTYDNGMSQLLCKSAGPESKKWDCELLNTGGPVSKSTFTVTKSE
jgi:hypothetical protein